MTRREFLLASASLLLASSFKSVGADAGVPPEPIIDIHQHTNYAGRTNEQFIAHQRAMGITKTILLPAGSLYGLAVKAGGNQSVVDLAKKHPGEFLYFANEVTDLPGARKEIEKYLKLGAIGIGEQKFHVDCDSKASEMVAQLARDYNVPVLLHFQNDLYNAHFERFPKMLEKFPNVNFVGHAITWWANIDKAPADPKVLYPTSKVTPGGLTDRWLSDYANLYADLSAQSGLNALIRDEDFTRGFLERHQEKLLYGSDCDDSIGRVSGCQGARTIAAIRRLAPSKVIERKLLYENAKRLFKL